MGGLDYLVGPCKHAQHRRSCGVKYRRGWPASNISPGDTSNSDHNFNRTAPLGHEAEEHYHSLDNVTTLSAKKGADLVDYMKNKHDEGNVLEEICPKCCKKFKCLSAGIYDDESGMMQYHADDCCLCDVCSHDRGGW